MHRRNGVSEPHRPASRARASTQWLHRAREYDVQHVNFEAPQHTVCREPLRPASHARASAQQLRRCGEHNVWHVNLDNHRHPVLLHAPSTSLLRPCFGPARQRPDEYSVQQANLNVPVYRAGGRSRSAVELPNPIHAAETRSRFIDRQARDGDDSVNHAIFGEATDPSDRTADPMPRSLPPRPGRTYPESASLPSLAPSRRVSDYNVLQSALAYART